MMEKNHYIVHIICIIPYIQMTYGTIMSHASIFCLMINLELRLINSVFRCELLSFPYDIYTQNEIVLLAFLILGMTQYGTPTCS